MTIEEAQQRVDAWINEYGVRYFSELTNMVCLTEEVGELARVIARRYGDQSAKKGSYLFSQSNRSKLNRGFGAIFCQENFKRWLTAHK